MIRYAVDIAKIESDVDAISATWRTRASAKTAEFEALGKYEETSSIWSEIKAVFMEIQFNKCVFCERQFEDQQFGKSEIDVEHFRPKGRIKAWPSGPDGPTYSFGTGNARETG